MRSTSSIVFTVVRKVGLGLAALFDAVDEVARLVVKAVKLVLLGRTGKRGRIERLALGTS